MRILATFTKADLTANGWIDEARRTVRVMDHDMRLLFGSLLIATKREIWCAYSVERCAAVNVRVRDM